MTGILLIHDAHENRTWSAVEMAWTSFLLSPWYLMDTTGSEAWRRKYETGAVWKEAQMFLYIVGGSTGSNELRPLPANHIRTLYTSKFELGHHLIGLKQMAAVMMAVE